MAHEITVPRLGWSMEQGTFLGWRKEDGQLVRAGEVLFELEGEKAAQEIESLDSGILRIPPGAPQPGTVVPVGALLGYLVAEGESPPFAREPALGGASDAKSSMTAAEKVAPRWQPAVSPSVRRLARELGVDLAAIQGTEAAGRITADDVRRMTKRPAPVPARDTHRFASPRARRVARELGIDWKMASGTGKSGRIRERDVRALANSAAAIERQRIPISARRRTIAQRMVASRQQTAPVTLTTRADATRLVELRGEWKAARSEPVPTYTDVLVKLTAASLEQHPLLAAGWDGEHLALPAGIHIGIAVDCDEGLLVPVIRDVPSLSLSQVALKSRELAARARAGKLAAVEMQGGVFTVTNLGGLGIDAFTPIVNLPEVAILGVGCIRQEPAILDGQIVPRHLMTLSLTFDHRIVDGAPAARFLQTIRVAVEKPRLLLPSDGQNS